MGKHMAGGGAQCFTNIISSFSYFPTKHMLWVFKRNVSLIFERVLTVLLNTQKLY